MHLLPQDKEVLLSLSCRRGGLVPKKPLFFPSLPFLAMRSKEAGISEISGVITRDLNLLLPVPVFPKGRLPL